MRSEGGTEIHYSETDTPSLSWWSQNITQLQVTLTVLLKHSVLKAHSL